MKNTEAKSLLLDLFEIAVDAAHPANCLPKNLPDPGRKTVVIGAGKGSAMMAHELEKRWQGHLEGVVVTCYGHTVPCQNIEIIEAGHPLPDNNSVKAAKTILAKVENLTCDDLVIVLISGGGSALLCLPPAGISLKEKVAVTSALLKSGASIKEINCVRKHISGIKGGRLALAAAPARIETWMISDVPGDDPSMIASGPTVADETDVKSALRIIQQYKISLSDGFKNHLSSKHAATPDKDDTSFKQGISRIIASPIKSLQAAQERAKANGFNVLCLGDALEGEACEVGKVHAGIAKSIKHFGIPVARPAVILSGGEVTVTIPRDKKNNGLMQGGPNQEFLLGLAQGLGSRPDIHAIACDTDGMDGSEPVAGATIHPDSLSRAVMKNLFIHTALETHNSYPFFKALGDLVETGPTFTNVNDFRAILVG